MLASDWTSTLSPGFLKLAAHESSNSSRTERFKSMILMPKLHCGCGLAIRFQCWDLRKPRHYVPFPKKSHSISFTKMTIW